MPLAWRWLDVDCHDKATLSEFWGGVFGIAPEPPDEDGDIVVRPPGGSVGLLFLEVPEAKSVKNRLHLDLTPDPGTQAAEVDRLLALGATRADVGQTGDESWVVLADPEGNEFCVLSGS